jgi:hypothetical protein
MQQPLPPQIAQFEAEAASAVPPQVAQLEANAAFAVAALNAPEDSEPLPSAQPPEEATEQPTDEAAAPPCSPQEQAKERRKRRTTMFVKGSATPDDARAKGQPSPLLQSPGLVAARQARRASGGTVLFQDPAPTTQHAASSEQRLARLSEGSRESQSTDEGSHSVHSSAGSSGPSCEEGGEEEEASGARLPAGNFLSRRASMAGSDHTSLCSESLTTASPCSGRSTRSSLGSADDPPDGGNARAIADFFSPFSPAARARYRASARDNVATPVYGADAAEGGAAAAGGGGNGGHNGGNASADEQQWAAAAAAWEAAAEAMTTAHEAELAEVARVANARVATAEAQAGMAMEEQAALHFLAEVQRQEGEARAAAFTKTLDQLHKTVRLAARSAPEKRQVFFVFSQMLR